MSNTHIALLRGINVGSAKRVAMADLRALVANLGYADPRTLLNSGNAVFQVPRSVRGNHAARIETAIAARLGIACRVTVLTTAQLGRIVNENPLLPVASNPSRLLAAILADPADRAKLLPLKDEAWGAEALGIGSRAAYLWCPEGILRSRLAERIGRLLGDGVTSRNWTTLTKLYAMAQP